MTLLPIRWVKAPNLNLAYAEALELYGSSATVLNYEVNEKDARIAICEVDTEGLDPAVLEEAINRPIDFYMEPSESSDMDESVAQMMSLIGNQKAFKHAEVPVDANSNLENEHLDMLSNMGFEYKYSKELISSVLSMKPDANFNDILQVLSKRIPYVEDDVIVQGGWISVMGPTGVGKTTTLSKIAALYSQLYSKEEIALVTVDTFRLGAVKQLETFAQALGIDFFVCDTPSDLMDRAAALSHKKLVLLDTAGKSQKDKLLHSQLRGFLSGNIKNMLVLNAGTQQDVIENTIAEFSEFGICGLVLTKLDEVVKLGAAITAVCKNKLPVQFLTTGQEVPSDIESASRDSLITRACDLAGIKFKN